MALSPVTLARIQRNIDEKKNGRGTVVSSSPTQSTLSTEDRVALNTALKRAGFTRNRENGLLNDSRYSNYQDIASSVNDDYINEFINDWDAHSVRMQTAYDGLNWRTVASKATDSLNSAGNDLLFRSAMIRYYLEKNKDQYEENWYNSFLSGLDSVQKYQRGMNKTFSDARKFYSQWDTEDDYNAWVEWEKNSEAGLRRYQDDQKAGNQGEETFWEKIGRYLGVSADTTLPNAGMSQVSDSYRRDTTYREPTADWNDEQEKTFGYFYAQDPEKAFKFAEQLNSNINAAKKAEQAQKVTDDATSGGEGATKIADSILNFQNSGTIGDMSNLVDHAGKVGKGLMHSAGAVLGNATGLADYLNDAAEYAARGRITEKTGDLTPFEYSQAVTGGISKHLNEKYGTLDENLYAIGGKGLGDLYGLGMSVAQSAQAAYTLGPVGTLVQFFGSAAASGVDDAKSRGASDEQALWFGALSGVAEGAAEAFGVDKLLKIRASSTMREVIINVAKQGIAEGAEEGITSVLNNFADQLVMGDKSNFHILVQDYMNKGWSEAEAKKQSWLDMAEDLAYDALGGVVSGTVHAGPQTAYESVLQNRAYQNVYGENEVADLVQKGLKSKAGSLSHELAVKYQEKMVKGGTLTGAEINRLVKANEQSILAEDLDNIRNDAAELLTTLGEQENVMALADVIAKKVTKQKVTRQEQAMLDGSSFGTWILDELSMGTARAENIRPVTDRITDNAQDYQARSEMQKQGVFVAPARTQQNQPAKREMEMPQREIIAPVTQQTAPEPKATVRENRTTQDSSQVPTVSQQTQEADVEDGDGLFSVSRSGKTVQISTGKTVEIAKVARTDGNGNMLLELSDGTKANAADIGYVSRGEAMLYEAVAKLGAGAETSNQLIDVYRKEPGNVSVEDYTVGMLDAFDYGRHKIPQKELAWSETIRGLTEKQRNTAYNLGKYFGDELIQNAQANARRARVAALAQESRNRAKQEAAQLESGVIFDRKGRTFSEAQETGLKTMEQLSKLLGTKFHVFESYEKDGKRVYMDKDGVEADAPNGFFDAKTGELYIDLNAGKDAEGTILFTVAHELTHFSRKWSPEKFDALAEAVFELAYGQKDISVAELVRNQQNRAGHSNRELSFDEAYEEVVADSMEAILADGNVMQELMENVKQRDATLWEKIKEWFRTLAEDIRKMVDAYRGKTPDSYEGRAVAKLEGMLPSIEGFYTAALLEASENYKAAEREKNTTQEDGKKYSYAGRIAQTANHSALEQAKQMQAQGEDNEQIRQKTGWYQGMDKKWRFEIDDSQMEIADNISNYMRLGDLLHHDPLFEAYPDMRDIDVVFQGLESGISGSYNPQFDSINLSYKLKNDPVGLKDALVHELQHAIQQREGFTKGATVESWERKKKAGFDSRRAADIRKAQETERELRRIQEEEPEFYRDMVELDAMTPDLPRGEIDWETLEKIEDDPVEWQQYDARREELEAKYGDTKVWDMNDLLYQREQAVKNMGRSGVELYFDTAGEIEARDASNRRSKSSEQRKSSPPRLGNEDTVFAERIGRSDQAIGKTFDNKPFVIVEKDILDGVDPSDWVRIVTQNIRNKYPNGVTIGRNNIAINQKSRRELTYSGYMHKLKQKDIQVYSDKLRSTDNLDEIIQATTDWVNEGMKHGRNDNIQDFARGTVLIRIGGNDYSAEVVVGTKTNGTMLLYDILNLQKTSISDKKTDASFTSESHNNSTDRQLASNEAAPLITGARNADETGGATSAVSINRETTDVKKNKSASADDADIRYSERDPMQQKASETLKRENEKLKADVSRLKELVKLQGKLTGGTLFTDSSVEAAARKLIEDKKVKGNAKELAALLKDFYGYVAKGEELTWESVQEAAQPAVAYLMENRKKIRSGYAQDILKDLRTRSISFNETQQTEAARYQGTFNDYRKSLFGSVRITKDGLPLDEAWQELAELYPGVFDRDMNAADMPEALAGIVDRMKNSYEDTLSYAEDMLWQDLTRAVYDSYWNVSTLYTVADKKQKEINLLKAEHARKMQELKEDHKASVAELRKDYRDNQERVRENRNLRQQKKKARQKIRKRIMELDRLLNRGDKKKNVKDGMTAMVGKSLKLAEALFMDEYSNRDMLRNGVSTQMTDEEESTFKDAQQLMARIESGAVLDGMEFASELEAQDYLHKLDGQLSGKMAKLKDVFARERKHMYCTTVSDLLGQLADEYSRLSEAEDGAVRASMDENVYAHLLQLQKDVGGTTVRDMTLRQLEDVADAFTMVLTTVRNANKMFAQNLKFKRDVLAGMVMEEIRSSTKKEVLVKPGKDALDSFSWNNLKPVYAFERLGSNTMRKLYQNIRSGQDVWSRDMQEADEFRREQYKKHNRKDWDFEKQHSFDFASGKVDLSLEQIMSLYAYSRREAALDHLLKGGFVFSGNTEVVVKKNGIQHRYLKKDATAYNLTAEELVKVIDTMTEEQKAFVEEMQNYLSDVMGGKGNEISLQMYGIRSFGEKNYFPLRSAGQYVEKAKEDSFRKEQGQISIVNSGFTKATTPHANNPITLDGFMDVWAEHVNDMSMYHGFVLPMEDFRRVYNYSTPNMEGSNSKGVNATIENTFGKAATAYIDQLYKDLNGGVKTDSTAGVINKGISMFKKGAVFASASVVVQQPSAIARAAALIDLKHFIGRKVDHKRHKLLWNEVKQYAPVAFVKEMGYFDTGMGRSAKDYLQAEKYSGMQEIAAAFFKDSDYRDEILGKAPAWADEVTWCCIWEAVKRETRERHSAMDAKSEPFLQLCGERFAEVIDKTQVYDSVLSRSANMRSKDTGMKMATAFMAEPTTAINMVSDALRKGKQGGKEGRRYCRKTIGSVVASQILNSFLVAWVYAARDDDEDETYAEKYLSAFLSGILDGINPATYIPFIKDVVSIVQGYDVERSDMAVISDLWNAYQQLEKDGVSAWMKVEGFVGSICQIFGLPLKNIMRDVRAAYQAYNIAVNGEGTTKAGIDYAVREAFTGDSVSNAEQLYKARMDGDDAHAARVEARYDDEDSANAAVRAAIKDEFMSDKLNSETALKHMVLYSGMDASEAHWLLDAWEYRKATGSDDGYSKFNDFYNAVQTGKNLKSVIREYIDNGVKESTLSRMITEHFKPMYIDMSKAERANIKGYLINAFEQCGADREGAVDKVNDWDFEAQYRFPYSDIMEAYLDEKISASELVDISINYGKREDFAELRETYNTVAKPAGMSADRFYSYYFVLNELEGERDDDGNLIKGHSTQDVRWEYINSLPIPIEQKDALHCAFYKANTLKKTPWHSN